MNDPRAPAERPRTRLARWGGHAAAALFGLALAVGLAEAGLRLLLPAGALASSSEDRFWLGRLQGRGEHGLAADDLVADPELGWRMKPSLAAPGVHHDARGFRQTLAHGPAPAPLRIVAIGDSFAYGLGVRDDETFEAFLEARPGVEVINAGVNGYGIDQALLLWERQLRGMAPRAVVLTYFVDDFYRNGLAVREGPKPRFVQDAATGRWDLLDPAESSRRAQASEAAASPWRIAGLAQRAWHRLQLRLGLVDEAALRPLARTSRYLLERLRQSVQASGAHLVVLYIGHPHGGAAEHAWIEAEVMQSCRDLSIDCIDTVREMAGPRWRDYYLPNAHWSPEGHRFAADQVARHLAERGGPEFAGLARPATASAR